MFPFPAWSPAPASPEALKQLQAAARTVGDLQAPAEERVKSAVVLKDAATDGSPEDLLRSGGVEALVRALTAEWPAGGDLASSLSTNDAVAHIAHEYLSPRRMAAWALASIIQDLSMMAAYGGGSALHQMGTRMAAAGLFELDALPAMLADALPRYHWGQNYGRVEKTTSPDQSQHLADRLLCLAASCAGLPPPVGPRVLATCADTVLEGYGGASPEALLVSQQQADRFYGPGQMDPLADNFCRFWAHGIRWLAKPAEQGRALVSKGLAVKLSKAPAAWMSGKQQALAALKAAVAH